MPTIIETVLYTAMDAIPGLAMSSFNRISFGPILEPEDGWMRVRPSIDKK